MFEWRLIEWRGKSNSRAVLKRTLALWVATLLLENPLCAQTWGSPDPMGRSLPSSEMPQRMEGEFEPIRRGARDEISIHIFGSVVRPGSYRAQPSERLVSLVQKAKGIRKGGSETRVELRRGRGSPRVVNLLMLRRTGDLSQNPFVQDNDVIFVPAMDAAVTVQGPVREPGDYEIPKQGTTLQRVIELADGFSTGVATSQPIVVIRYGGSSEPKTFKVDNSVGALNRFRVNDGDVVQVPHIFTVKNEFNYSVKALPNDNISYPTYANEVFILGGVNRPGPLPYEPRHRLANYVALAGGNSRLGRKDCSIRRATGEMVRTTIQSEVVVNPGDTVLVGEDRLGPEFWVGILTTITGMGMTAYGIFSKD